MLVIELGGEARAYPVRILDFHGIVNEAVGGRPVPVTWCPLCGSGVVYDREVSVAPTGPDDRSGRSEDGDDPSGDARTLSFGVSGKLAAADLVMYDRETGSEWKQSTGRAIDGPLAGPNCGCSRRR